jgi:O-antigen ligase
MIGQTRSTFLALPVALLLSLGLKGSVRIGGLLKQAAIGLLLLALIWTAFAVLMPSTLTKSVEASVDVVIESLQPETIGMLFSGDITSETRNLGLSQSGNTAFRLLAWAQVIQEVDEVEGGKWIGAPLGSGYYFYDESGTMYTNLDPHNDYISIWSKVGWIGLAGYLLILASLIRAYLRTKKLSARSLGKNVMTNVLGILFLLLLFVGFNAEVRSYGSHFWIWAVLGFGFKAVHDILHRAHPSVAANVNAVVIDGR